MASSAAAAARPPTVVIDNGGAFVRVGLATDGHPRATIPNRVGRLKGQLQVVVGDETEPGAVVQDSSQLVLACPVERGIVTDWRTQLAVWRRALSVADISARGAPVVLLSPPLMPSKSLAGLAQAALAPDGAADDETAGLGAASLCIVAPTRAACRLACGLAGAQQRQQAPAGSPAAPLWSAGLRLDPALGGAGAPFSLSMGCCVVVDAGFSGVTVAPYVYALGSEAIGTPAAHDATPPAALPAEHCIGSAGGPDSAPASTCVASGLRRGPVGGRLLGGLTRDWISFRSVDLSDDVTLARAVAERAGIVPLHDSAPRRALEPPPLGGFEAQEAVVELGPERLVLGESLLRPGDAAPASGLDSCPGIAASVADSIAAAAEAAPAWSPLLWQGVVLTGGVARMPGLAARLQRELRSAASELAAVTVWSLTPEGDDNDVAWRGGALLARSSGGLLPSASAAEWARAAETPGINAAVTAVAELMRGSAVL
ncbi:hypothetical protein FNF31_00654 [Cafeteria roenbergensis]|uniref:Actin-related protein 8 n=1 Tax=Cafeteria roenbergensis TaxID=33653 RepID=A0A5A8DRC6_CAFRO|nr:hypothetical protein FNF31_00654 [Cafeteria roenbergensis]